MPNIFSDHITSPAQPPKHGGIHWYRKIAKDDRRYLMLIIDRTVGRGAYRFSISVSVPPFLGLRLHFIFFDYLLLTLYQFLSPPSNH
jgi:hypothetical protein